MKFKKFVYKKIKSTNLIAHKKIKSGYKSGIVIAELQTKGKGQYGKKWISIRGNVFLSIFLNLNKKILLKNTDDNFTKFNYAVCLKFTKNIDGYFKLINETIKNEHTFLNSFLDLSKLLI